MLDTHAMHEELNKKLADGNTGGFRCHELRYHRTISSIRCVGSGVSLRLQKDFGKLNSRNDETKYAKKIG